jgi:hypothetical protein
MKKGFIKLTPGCSIGATPLQCHARYRASVQKKLKLFAAPKFKNINKN